MVSSSNSWILPFEIVEAIIDLLAEENDLDSLKATSLICQSLLPRCRKYLFSSLKIDKKSLARCPVLFSPQTDIPKYVRRLEYHWNLNEYMPFIEPALLERVSFLQALTFRYSDRMGCFDWIQMHPLTLLNLMRLPTLTHLNLVHIKNFPVSALSSCPGLKCLELDNVEMENKLPCLLSSSSDISTAPRIQEYVVRRSATTTMRLLTALDWTNLKILSVDFETDEDVKATQCLLKQVKQVEELRIRMGNYHPVEYLPASFTSHASITFHIFGTIVSLSAWDVLALCDELSAMASPGNTLKTLRLEIKIDSAVKLLSRGEWKNVDAILTSPKWSFLEHFSLDIESWEYSRVTEEELKLLTDLPNTQLTRLSRGTSLDFKFSAPSVALAGTLQ